MAILRRTVTVNWPFSS